MPSAHTTRRTGRPGTPLAHAALAAILGLGLVPWLAPATAQPRGLSFSDRSLTLDSIGMTLPMPEGVAAQDAPPDSPLAARITPKGDASWFIGIQITEADGRAVQTREFTENIIHNVRKTYGVVRTDPDDGSERIASSDADVLDRNPDLRIADLEADRVYLRVPTGDGNEQPDHAVTGYTVVRRTPRQFVIFQLNTPEAGFQEARTLYETLVAAAEFREARKMEAERGAAVMRGRETLSRISATEFAQLIDGFGQRWERLYRPAANAPGSEDQELGYRRVRAWKGRRGQVQLGADPDAFDQVESEEGFLVAVDARLLRQDGRMSDIASRYFVTPDRSEEAWSVRMTLRSEDSVASTYTETGVRVDDTLKVAVNAPGEPPETVRPLIEGLGYITQVQTYLLPELLIEAGVPGEYGFYTYETSKQAISYRAVEAEREEDTERWTITTTISGSDRPRTSIYDDQGRFRRTELPDGRIWTRTTLDELVERWRRKGLPIR